MRREYLRAAVAQPILFRTPRAAVVATIEATADHLEAQGTSSTELLHHAVDPPRLSRQEPEAITTRALVHVTDHS